MLFHHQIAVTQVFCILSSIGVVNIFYFSHSYRFVVIFHCDFHFISLVAKWYWTPYFAIWSPFGWNVCSCIFTCFLFLSNLYLRIYLLALEREDARKKERGRKREIERESKSKSERARARARAREREREREKQTSIDVKEKYWSVASDWLNRWPGPYSIFFLLSLFIT